MSVRQNNFLGRAVGPHPPDGCPNLSLTTLHQLPAGGEESARINN